MIFEPHLLSAAIFMCRACEHVNQLAGYKLTAGWEADGRQRSATPIAHRSLPGNKTLMDLHQLFVQTWREGTPLEVLSTKPPPRLLLIFREAGGADSRPVALFVIYSHWECPKKSVETNSTESQILKGFLGHYWCRKRKLFHCIICVLLCHVLMFCTDDAVGKGAVQSSVIQLINITLMRNSETIYHRRLFVIMSSSLLFWMLFYLCK